jgi:DNA-binding transcriptional MocR family regulator
LHLVGRLRAGLDERRAAELAAAEGVRVSPLSRFTIGERSRSQPGALLLSYAAYDERQIREGVESLGRALERA